jgi:adenylate kinase
MRIAITGTPGTGKSSVSRILAKRLGLKLIDVKEIARSAKLVSKTGEVDISKLSAKLSFLKKESDFIVEGHLACETKLPCDNVFVLRCDPRVLRRRLSKRGYSKNKNEENLESEMLDYCSQRVMKVYRMEPLEVDTSKRTPAASAAEIERAIRHKKKRIDSVDYSSYLVRLLLKGK